MSLTSKINHDCVPNERIRQKFMMTTIEGKWENKASETREKSKFVKSKLKHTEYRFNLCYDFFQGHIK